MWLWLLMLFFLCVVLFVVMLCSLCLVIGLEFLNGSLVYGFLFV